MPVSMNNTVGASPITPMSSTAPVTKPTSALAPRVEQAEQGPPEDARVADQLRNPDRQIWDAPGAVLNVVAQYVDTEQLGALHALSPGFAQSLDTPPHSAALAIPQLLQDIKAWKDEQHQLDPMSVSFEEDDSHFAKWASLQEQIVQAENVIEVAELRRIGKSAVTLDEWRSAEIGFEHSCGEYFQ
jgi:hypothetical protein